MEKADDSALGAVAVPAEAATPTAKRLTIQIDGLRQGNLQLGADRGRDLRVAAVRASVFFDRALRRRFGRGGGK